MKLYHGTNYSSAKDICINGIDLNKSQPYLDFGAGFYTTPDLNHAMITACRKTEKYNRYHGKSEEPCMVEMRADFGNQSDFNILQFPRHSAKWGEFVLNNRLHPDIISAYNISNHNQDLRYDICYGEIADGTIVNIAYLVNNGSLLPKDVNYQKFLKSNQFSYSTQYSFHTENSLSCINGLRCGIISNKEKYYINEGR